ncbi:MAG: hypothetical protein OEL56_06535 [Nitrosopumilus sp.]|nr:hypothetical protein [Nitrosopumilus sp.]MDH3490088.1 hypothetical protein [Nitrosopumilus sp.]MDH3517284.1 hypothetical protein [Nitrosopumilus sp.]MDH5416899.1 hypothetical protein [Nitrosopumilus sp.]MDH5555335.1 hypothetical protein [Nitrosopumilus sp.]
MRPYVLRAYFDTQLLLAESHGKMTHAYRQFFMGHKGDIEDRYTTNKGRLTDEMIADMRRAYMDSQQFLCTINTENNAQNKKEILLDMWREQAKLYVIDPFKIKIEKQRTSTEKTFSMEQETDTIRQEIIKKMKSPKTYDGKIVTGDEQLLHHITQGWEPIKELAENRIIIRKKIH